MMRKQSGWEFGRSRIGFSCVVALVAAAGLANYTQGQESISPFENQPFVPDGNIGEFINFSGDSQNYFITDLALNTVPPAPDFGAIKVGVTLTNGVFVGRDNSPVGDAGPTGFFDPPSPIDIPTGFNIGRVFMSYNPSAFGGTGGYFIAMDISAPGELDRDSNTQPVAFDLDGDGSTMSLSEIADDTCFDGGFSEAPSRGQLAFVDNYTISIDTDPGTPGEEVTILIGEVRSIFFNTLENDGAIPLGLPQSIPTNEAQTQFVNVQRFVRFFDNTLTLPQGQDDLLAKLFLDADGDGDVDEDDIGVGDDIELAIRNVNLLPTFTTGVSIQTPACVGFAFTADSFDDECLQGGGEDATSVEVIFPVPDIEAGKLVRCADEPASQFDTTVRAVPGSEVEFEVTVTNYGNIDLEVELSDTLENFLPATASLVAGSCQVVGAAPAGVIANFCDAFENAMSGPGGFPLSIGTLAASDPCIIEAGESLVFRYRVLTGPADGHEALCDQGIDIRNSVSVTARSAAVIDPILGPTPLSGDSPNANSEEEDCDVDDGGCCTGIPGCVEDDGIGDVEDEFNVEVSDLAGVADTPRELAGSGDDNVAEVELECRDFSFEKTSTVVGAGGTNLPGNPSDYPVDVEYTYQFQNSGEFAEDIEICDTQLCDDVNAVAGASFVSCPLCTAAPLGCVEGTVNPSSTFSSTCRVQFATQAAALAFTALDDARAGCGNATPECYENCATVSTEAADGSGVICDEGATDGDNAEICVRCECELDVEKQVRCLENCPDGAPVGGFVDLLEVTAGSCAQYEFTVRNLGACSVYHTCLNDELTCNWNVSGFSADINGMDVTDQLIAAGFDPNSGRTCIDFAGPSGNGIAPGETLTVRFSVEVPDNFPVVNKAVDCRNTISVEGYEDQNDNTNEPPDASCKDSDSAEIDVRVPQMICGKTVEVDLGDDGSVNIPATTLANIATPVFPMRLTYVFSAHNTGELPITGAEICDTSLVADAVAAGLTIGSCDLCSGACDGVGDTCASLGNLDLGASGSATCEIVVPDQGAWSAFAGLDKVDGRGDCYTNIANAEGDVLPACAPSGFPGTVDTDEACRATVCISTVPDCPPIKAKFDIWNQNEIRFSGTERCIVSWDQKLLSEYTPRNIANHFLRTFLQTTKGKARIDGLSSSVCSESIDAPLLGAAAKVVNFGPSGIDLAGSTLKGMGTEAGLIKYDLPGGPSGLPPSVSGPGSEENRVSVSKKGSLLFYSKVEIKWRPTVNGYEPVQDTFLDITNDHDEDVLVQLYFINGDKPADAIFVGDPPREVERAHLGCNAVDAVITLTGNEPTYWSALTGDPKGVQPFTLLDPGYPPGRPDSDPWNPNGRVLRGYVLAWAVNAFSEEIQWNHLKGDAVVINYTHGSAWEYRTWNFAAVAGNTEGDLLLTPLGQLNLDGAEYDYPPDKLLFDFYSSGTYLQSDAVNRVMIDTDLTLWGAVKDLRSR